VDQTQVFWISYVALGVLCTLLELIRPARILRYRKAVVLDTIGFAVYQFAVFPLAVWVCMPLAGHVALPDALRDVWLPVRVVAFYLVADCGSYWMHRLMHTRHLWRIHRWHHSPTQLYWFAGARATLPQQILFNLPYIAAAPLLAGIPLWVIFAMTIEAVLRNNWMHMNVTWRSHWLERVLVTPRYHHIHHSAEAQLHDGNYGSLFSIWDRLFGTYIDPDVTVPRSFGTGEKPRDPILLMLGL
jgi:sterol desaturase/sphingolipid hydroxylase (fatty acid hydroxylase superfamily)